jgi:hypothetical protein
MSNLNWIEKLKIECLDEPDGTMTITVTWDETDPEMEYWTSLGEEGQKAFMLDALHNALDSHVD